MVATPSANAPGRPGAPSSRRTVPLPKFTTPRIGAAALVAALVIPIPSHAQDTPGQAGPDVVGTIEMAVDGETWHFDVVEGPVTEGFATGYSAQPRGEAIALGASLYGRHRGSAATVNLTVGVWQASLEHMCDPFANQLRFSPADERATSKRLRPGERASESCPPAEGRPGGLSLHIDLAGAELDEETGELVVRGTFSGPLGRGDDARQITDGRFEATLRPFESLSGG